jgi:DNA-binding Lrp family transcriptional regulator
MHAEIELKTGAGQASGESVPSNGGNSASIDDIDRRLLNEFQRNFPLTATPYADIARCLGVSEQIVIERLQRLQAAGTVSRVGPVFRPNRIGASTLAAMAVPAARLEEVAAVVSAYAAVNHNYEREHDYNLWFVAAAADETKLAAVLDDIAARTGLEVMSLPMLEDYHIDLGFDLRWT